MDFEIKNGNLTVYHTEVAESLKNLGVASGLLSAMVSYAGEKQLKVIPLCPYVDVQFTRHASNSMMSGISEGTLDPDN